ncbi:roundabout homolog 2-like [Eriocheir sinensis]|uniref:roundabout homolog 2-like n=1 Tax=Eriocheir sinensis TaxID=95602 RepID=UPI0021C8E099|nr:roundabout homolog 2-like [Eriocheir sinensis]
MLMFKQALPDGEQVMLFVGNLTLRPFMRLTKVGNSFTLSGVRRSHAGRYVCRIETSPAIEVTHTLDVQYPATVRRVGEEMQQVLKGSTVTLECMTEGNPPAAITWSHQHAHLPAAKQANKQGQSIITLENVDKQLEGTYTCTASNGVGAPSSASTTIQVEYPPEVYTEQAMVHTGEGDLAQLVCVVEGRPTPTVSWTKGGLSVDPTRHMSKHNGRHHHGLTISGVTTEDFGEYTCSAVSPLGSANATIRLTGLPRTPKITSSPAGGEKTTYTLTWETETYTPITMYRLQYRERVDEYMNSIKQAPRQWTIGLHNNRTFWSHHGLAGNIQHMSHPIVDLQPATDYEAVVSVENKFGWSGDSEVFHFYTRKEMAVGHSTSGGEMATHTQPLLLLFLLPLLLLFVSSPLLTVSHFS